MGWRTHRSPFNLLSRPAALALAILLALVLSSCSEENAGSRTGRSVRIEVQNRSEVELTDVEVSAGGETARRDRLGAGEEPGLVLRLTGSEHLDHPTRLEVTWIAHGKAHGFRTTAPVGEAVIVEIATPDGSEVGVSTHLHAPR